jgi:hypothetical protein
MREFLNWKEVIWILKLIESVDVLIIEMAVFVFASMFSIGVAEKK